ncbi:Beta-hexosaminidase 2 [Camellia lanceoleosa]|uniref:Beta-hexosaminidase 2 n=1 Tax=Camellia lanceoleosa TaxID=1840588 RepID=A0ACC0IJC0_9ERIC|nr:Beta-hexosaminidase 2 [Camellia lanceoleosa]
MCFHWHITNLQSFPLVLPSEPDLAEKGSYGAEIQYSPKDVKRIVEFGLEHGVRVLPEIGHIRSWAGAHPEIMTCANMFWWLAGSLWGDRIAFEPGSDHLNPLNPMAYQVIKNVIHDIATMFPESFYHTGANEIVPGCWKVDPFIQTFLANNGTLSQLLEIFINTTFPYIVSLN